MTLALTALLNEDSQKLFTWINDRDLVIKNNPYQPTPESDHNSWFEALGKNGDKYFAIRVVNHLIGVCSLRNINTLARSAELQIRIGEKTYQGRGFGTLAVKELVQYGFKDLNLNRIYLDVYHDNLSAIKVYEKNAFQREGEFLEADYVDGQYKNVIRMALLRKNHSVFTS